MLRARGYDTTNICGFVRPHRVLCATRQSCARARVQRQTKAARESKADAAAVAAAAASAAVEQFGVFYLSG